MSFTLNFSWPSRLPPKTNVQQTHLEFLYLIFKHCNALTQSVALCEREVAFTGEAFAFTRRESHILNNADAERSI